MTIRDYLTREAEAITERALVEFTEAARWRRLLPEKRRQYYEMMGVDDLLEDGERDRVPYTVTGVVDREGYRIEKLYYEALPRLYVAANLYLPTKVEPPHAGVLYTCGHAATQKVWYQAHPRRFAQLGFAALAVETVQLGEVRGYHHGCYREGWWHWYSRGYTPAGMEMFNGIRGLDLLAQHDEVDGDRLGVTGISGGGAASWWIAAGDPRVRVSAPVCGTATLASHIRDRTIDGHCDCMWWINTRRWDLADVGALIAPRPLMIASADRDGIFTIASIRHVHEQLQPLYRELGAADNLRLVVTPGPHSYHELSRTAIFSFFLHHLQGRDVAPEEVGDIDDSPEAQESEDTLRVFVNGPLPDDLTPTIHDQRYTPPAPPRIETREDLNAARRRIIDALRATTFGAFPTEPAAGGPTVEFEFAGGNSTGCRFSFQAEKGWRLHGRLTIGDEVSRPAPALIALRLPGEPRMETERWLSHLPFAAAKVVIEPRGTGDTAWGEDLNWHVRRAAAWTGRTIASMRVWDVLRGLDAVRQLDQVDAKRLTLAARGEMTVVALFAALLDAHLEGLTLESPVATLNLVGEPDGRGPAIELLGALRIADLPTVAGLLHPMNVVVRGDAPDSYQWSQAVYARLGMPERWRSEGR